MSRNAVITAVLAAILLAPNGAAASLVAYIGSPNTVAAGDTGQLEVFLRYDGTGPAINANVYQIGLDIVAPGDPAPPFEAEFTGAISTTGTTEPYIFSSSFGAKVVTFDNADPTKLVYGDLTGSGRTLNPGDLFSLGFVSFTGSTPGTYPVNFTEATVNNNVIGTTGGSITINPAAVPEPSTTLLLGLLAVAALGVTRWRRGRLATGLAAG